MAGAQSSDSSSAWIRRFQPADDAETRLICLPHAGGSATYFFPVAKAMAPSVDVLALQYPGRQDRRSEPCVEDARQLADHVVAELKPWLDRPFSLFGHSLGATVGYEVALRLEAQGAKPLGLFASGRRAPSRHRDEQVHLSDDDTLIARVKNLSGTDEAIFGDEELLRMVLPTLRSDYKAAEGYRYQDGPKLGCPVLALTGDSDPEVTMDEVHDWSKHTENSFDVQIFTGGHFYLNDHPGEVIRTITDHIEKWTSA